MSDIRHTRPTFKGWTKPGPMPDKEQMHQVELGEHETLDALSGHWRIFQLRAGHRFSTDDLLCAWYATCWAPSPQRALDLGSGIGSVAMICLWRHRGLHVVGVEAQPMSVALADKSARYNGITERYERRCGDFRDPGVLGPHERFDLITGSPPYFPLTDGPTSAHPQRVACRFEVRGDIADYCRVARAHLAPAGVFVCVFPQRPDHQLARLEQAAQRSELTIVRRRPVCLDGGAEPLLTLALMQRAEDLPAPMRQRTFVEPTLIIRHAGGALSEEYAVIKLSFGFPP